MIIDWSENQYYGIGFVWTAVPAVQAIELAIVCERQVASRLRSLVVPGRVRDLEVPSRKRSINVEC